MDRNKNLRLALPSSGNLYEPSLNFLKASGLNVSRINSRRYTATIPSMKNVEVIPQGKERDNPGGGRGRRRSG